MNGTILKSSDENIQSAGSSHASKPRVLQLDILRGIAILLVIGFHFVIDPSSAGVLSPLAMSLRMFGWTGVDLFFVLSGFLVGGLLLKELRTESKIDARRFIIRRGFKIWPSYFAFLAALFVIFVATGNGIRTSAMRLLPNLLHIQNYMPGPRGHTWSLAVEEHFYLLLPLLLLLLSRKRRDGTTWISLVPLISVGVIILCTAMRILKPVHGGLYSSVRWTHLYPTHMRADSLFFGVLLAYLYHFRPQLLDRIAGKRMWLFILGIALVSPMTIFPIWSPFVSTIGYSLLYFGYGCILLATLYTPIGEGAFGRLLGSFPARALAFIGVYSFPIYIWHIDGAQEPLIALVRRGFLAGLPSSVRWLIITFLYVLIATLVGVVMGRLIERPALRLREYLFPSRVDPVIHVPVIDSNPVHSRATAAEALVP